MTKPQTISDNELIKLSQSWLNPEEYKPPYGRRIVIIAKDTMLERANLIIWEGKDLYLCSYSISGLEKGLKGYEPSEIKYWIPCPE